MKKYNMLNLFGIYINYFQNPLEINPSYSLDLTRTIELCRYPHKVYMQREPIPIRCHLQKWHIRSGS